MAGGWRGITGLGLALLAAAGLALLGHEPPAAPTAWLDEAAASSREVLAHHDGKMTLRLERIDAHWWLTAPYRRRANPDRVAYLLDLARQPAPRALTAEQVDLPGAGLAEPGWRLSLGDIQVEFGEREPLGEGRYLRSGDRIVVLADRWLPLLQAGPAALASLALVRPDAELSGVITPLAAIRQTDTGWQDDAGGLGDTSAMAQAWQQGSALTIQALTAEAVSLGQARLTYADGSEQVYELAESATGLALRDRAAGYELLVDAELAGRLLQPVEAH